MSIYKPLNYNKKIISFFLGAPLDLLIMNRNNQYKPNVCQSVVLKVYFQKKVLWTAEFYLFCCYNSNNFGPSKCCFFFSLHFQIQFGEFDKFWKIVMLKNVKFFWRTTIIYIFRNLVEVVFSKKIFEITTILLNTFSRQEWNFKLT